MGYAEEFDGTDPCDAALSVTNSTASRQASSKVSGVLTRMHPPFRVLIPPLHLAVLPTGTIHPSTQRNTEHGKRCNDFPNRCD